MDVHKLDIDKIDFDKIDIDKIDIDLTYKPSFYREYAAATIQALDGLDLTNIEIDNFEELEEKIRDAKKHLDISGILLKFDQDDIDKLTQTSKDLFEKLNKSLDDLKTKLEKV